MWFLDHVQSAEPGRLAIGDAAGYVEPFTDEGMAWALASALVVAPLVAGGCAPRLAASWAALYRRTVRRRQGIAWAAAWALRRPLLVRSLVALLSIVPGLAAPFVSRLNSVRPRAVSPFRESLCEHP